MSTDRNLTFLSEAKRAGYRIYAVFVLTNDSRINVRRVKERVLAGGHDVPEEKIVSRTENLIRQVAGRNADKPIFVISPFYNCGDDFNEEKRAGGERWRRLVGEITAKLNYPNVTYINGLDVLGDMSYMSADEVHPNIYGVQRIADVMTEKIRTVLENR